MEIMSFLTGNSQGKMQKDGTLSQNRAKNDYLLQPFQKGKLIIINIPMPTNGGKAELVETNINFLGWFYFSWLY